MSVQIVVSDPLPVFRQGLLTVLGSEGLDQEAPGDLLAWSREEQSRIVFLTLESSQDWTMLAELRKARASLTVIAVLTDVSTPTYVRAIRSGASAAVPRDATPEIMRRVYEAAVNGQGLLPLDVIHALAVAREVAGEQDRLSPREIEWLRGLAHGATVAQLAQHAGYSERAMFRLLRDLYARMQVSNRTEALMRANERGWL